MKKIISIILCALLAIPSFVTVFATENAVSFSDVDANSMQGKAINILAAAGIVSGNGDGTFAPGRGVTRAELCKMVNNIYGYTQEDETAFTDVTPDKWYYSHVKIAKKAGYINGFEDGTFRGDSPVTREQACAIVVRVAGIYDLGIPVTIADPVSPWAEGYVKTIIANQLIPLEEGNRFRATEPMTRGELSVPLSNFVGSKGTTQPGGTSTGGGVSIGGGSSGGSGSGSGGNRPSSGGNNTPSSPSKPSTPSTPSTPSNPSTPSEPSTPSNPSTPSDPTPDDKEEIDTNKDIEYTVTVKGAGVDVTETKKDGSIYKLPEPVENADTFLHWEDKANGITKAAGAIIFVRGNYSFEAVLKQDSGSDDEGTGNEGETPDTGDEGTITPPEDDFDQTKQAEVVEYLNIAKTSLGKIEFGIDVLDIMCDAILDTIDKTLADAAKNIKIYEEGYVETAYADDITSVRAEYDSWNKKTQDTFKSKLATDIESYVLSDLLEIMFGIDDFNPQDYITK